jgi:hypothetical protein
VEGSEDSPETGLSRESLFVVAIFQIGHLRRNCLGRGLEEVSEDTTLHRDIGDLEGEVDSTWAGCRFPMTESTPSPERDDTISGKLNFYCPALYNSLSLWEKEELNASMLLKNLLSSVEFPSGVVKENLVINPLGSSSLPDNDIPSSGGLGGSSSLPTCVRGVLPVLESQLPRPESLV